MKIKTDSVTKKLFLVYLLEKSVVLLIRGSRVVVAVRNTALVVLLMKTCN